GLEPACIKACPTGCLQFGTKQDMVAAGQQRVAELKAHGFVNAALYDPPGVKGTGVATVLAHGDHPERYGLPRDPHAPWRVAFSRRFLLPLGLLATCETIAGVFGPFLRHGPKKPPEGGPPDTQPPARA